MQFFCLAAALLKLLLSTGDLILTPDHHQEPDAPAAWQYFDILMQIRAELRNGQL